MSKMTDKEKRLQWLIERYGYMGLGKTMTELARQRQQERQQKQPVPAFERPHAKKAKKS